MKSVVLCCGVCGMVKDTPMPGEGIGTEGWFLPYMQEEYPEEDDQGGNLKAALLAKPGLLAGKAQPALVCPSCRVWVFVDDDGRLVDLRDVMQDSPVTPVKWGRWTGPRPS